MISKARARAISEEWSRKKKNRKVKRYPFGSKPADLFFKNNAAADGVESLLLAEQAPEIQI